MLIVDLSSTDVRALPLVSGVHWFVFLCVLDDLRSVVYDGCGTCSLLIENTLPSEF